MALQPQSLNIDFSQGLDLKTDPLQLSFGKFLELENVIFNKFRRLQKRNGFKELPSLPSASYDYTTTFNGNLLAIGQNITAFSSGSETWVAKGSIIENELHTSSLVRTNTNQSWATLAVSENGLVCTVFTDNVPSGGSNVAIYKYVISDLSTGQNIVAPAVITPTSGTVTGSPKVFSLGKYFIIVFTNVITATNHLQYIAINTINLAVGSNVDITSQYTPATTVAWDGAAANNTLYLAWNGSDVGGAIRMTSLDSTLTLHSTVVFATYTCTIMNLSADIMGSTPVVYASFYTTSGTTGYVLAVNQNLSTVLAPTQIITTGTVRNITATAQNSVCTVVYELAAAYSYDGGIATNRLLSRTVTVSGSVGTLTSVLRGVGLASDAFLINGTQYMLAVYSSVNQPSYFLITGIGGVVGKLAYSNGQNYLVTGIPDVTVIDDVAYMSYLVKDDLIPVNKTQGITNASAVYAQLGVNMASWDFSSSVKTITAEIGKNLNLTGGILWAYDGYLPVEQGFNVWPDYVEVTTSGTGGLITAQAYFYVAVYEWTDNQGNIFRSAPSIPVTITTTGTTSSNMVNVPTLRLTYKTANPVKITVFRWSTAQQTYYQVTSVLIPTLNSTSVDSIAFVDTLADSAILGNSILYTTGGVIENIGPPSAIDVSLYKSRLFLIDAEDRNLLWFSKQVIEGTPIEMSDLLTRYIAPTTGAQGSTGDLTCTAPMDDKLILFKENAIYYIIGTGPDNTGANDDFSEPIFITSTVGTANKNSIVFMPQGLMFQSDKGIWLLGRDLSTSYIGAAVEDFNAFTVESALNIPETNQVRFTLSNGVTLMYDYYFSQWGSFVGIPAISSTLYLGMHTFIDSYGRVFQENPGSYLDGSRPVLISFKTGWMNMAGLQGYQRAYQFYLLGKYLSPHRLTVGIAYNYESGPSQQTIITPDNYTPNYGGDSLYGGTSPYGGPGDLEQWQVYFEKGKCQSFQLSISETFDSTLGAPAGEGLTLSGINMVVGLKKSYFPVKAQNSAG